MTLIYVGALNCPNYFAESTDVSTGKITGASRHGNTVFLVDTKTWWILDETLTLQPWVLPVEATIAGDVVVGGVTIEQPVADAIEITPNYDTRAVTTHGTAEALKSTDTYALSLLVFPASGNAGNVYLGTSGVDYQTSKQIIITPTSSYVGFDAPLGYKLNLKKFYVDADHDSDGVYYMYLA